MSALAGRLHRLVDMRLGACHLRTIVTTIPTLRAQVLEWEVVGATAVLPVIAGVYPQARY
jgi:hypothetical protein